MRKVYGHLPIERGQLSRQLRRQKRHHHGLYGLDAVLFSQQAFGAGQWTIAGGALGHRHT